MYRSVVMQTSRVSNECKMKLIEAQSEIIINIISTVLGFYRYGSRILFMLNQ